MKYLRKGGGCVYGYNTEVDSNSNLKYSAISDHSDIYRSHIVQSLCEKSTVYLSSVFSSNIKESKVSSSSVMSSSLEKCSVVLSSIKQSDISECKIYGSVLRDMIIRSDCVLSNCEVSGFSILAPVHIEGGVWTQMPRYFILNTAKAKNVVITEGIDGIAYIGCVGKPVKRWLKGADRFCKVIGWGKEEKDSIVNILNIWLKDDARTI